MKIRRLIAASILLLGIGVMTGLRTTARVDEPVGIQNKGGHLSAINRPDISLDQANLAIDTAIAKSVELGVKMDIAVVDVGGSLKAFARMDDACLGCIDIAIRKARTARLFDRSTGELGKLSQPGGPLYAIEHSNEGLITFPGGVLIKDDAGRIMGAIGVSGDTVENDDIVAQAGANAL
ncbi:MAG: heme-binding protein [Leptolyngbyaceae cyanobacterium MO_188.B28]|nr:heme-binding protein [Leptolyngbyaceae cyanobacterium MO_188.B28]